MIFWFWIHLLLLPWWVADFIAGVLSPASGLWERRVGLANRTELPAE